MPEPIDAGGAPPPPERIGRYEVVRELGRGSMGIVYEARDTTLGRTVALKTIDPSLAAAFGGREEFEKRFFAEARIAARLSHPGIVVCHDVGKDVEHGTLFIVLEYLKGQTLAERLKAGPMPWYEAAAIVARVARAMGHAHAHGVVHRDLKPANIMLLETGEPKVLDFGIAKVETARLKVTSAGQVMGSPAYMSPEQARGEDPIDGRSDIFTLGSIYSSLLVGRPYFSGPNIPAILERILREDPPQASRLAVGAPSTLDPVVARAMARSPADRYPRAEMLADDLEDILGSRTPANAAFWTPGHALDTAPQDPLDELRALVDEALPEAPRGLARPPKRIARTFLAAAVVVGALAVGFALVARSRPLSPPPEPADPPVRGAPREDPPAEASAPASAAKSRLHLTVEHPLKSGQLQLFVDDVLAYETPLKARVARKIVAIKVREEHIEATLPLEPGRRRVRVEVRWDGNRRAESTTATFNPGGQRVLEVRVGLLQKALSLEWK